MKKGIKFGLVLLLIIIACSVSYFILNRKEEQVFYLEESERTVSPTLYQACDEDSCVYLLGTIHMGDKRLDGLTDKILRAYNESDAIAFEIDLNKEDMTNTDTLMFLDEDDDLSNYMTEEQFKKLENFCFHHLLSIDVVRTMNLAGLYNVLSVWGYMELNYSADYGVDNQLTKQAYKDNKEIIELETAQFQMDLLLGFSDEFYLKSIMETIDDFNMGKGYIRLLYDSYISGNTWLLRGMLSSDSEGDELEQKYNDEMLTKRNNNMCDKTETFLKDNKKVMVAVGAAHVVGDGGLVEQLREKGYTVNLVK